MTESGIWKQTYGQHSQSPTTNNPEHDKTNKMTRAPSEDTDQSENSPSLIRAFAVHMKKLWDLSLGTLATLERTAKTQIIAWRTCHCVGFVMLRLNCFYLCLTVLQVDITKDSHLVFIKQNLAFSHAVRWGGART